MKKISQRDIEDDLVEDLSDLIHEEWESWSKAVAKEVSEEKKASWKKNWIPYKDLDEETKDYDRVWAKKVIKKLKEYGLLDK